MTEMKKRQVFIQLDDESDEDTRPQQEYQNSQHRRYTSDHDINEQDTNNIQQQYNEEDDQQFQQQQQQDQEDQQISITIMDQQQDNNYNSHSHRDECDNQNYDEYNNNNTSSYANQDNNTLQVYNNSSQNQTNGDVHNESKNRSVNNYENTPEMSQLQQSSSQNLAQEDNIPDNDYQLMEEPGILQDQEVLDRVLQQAIERQDNIIYAIGEESQLPMIDAPNINNLADLCQELNNQLQFIFDYYEDLRKTNAQKFNSTHTQRQLIRDKENLNTMLKQQTDENKDLMVKIKQYNEEIEELQKRINQNNHENNQERLSLLKQPSTQKQPSVITSGQSRTPKNVVKQFINLDTSPTNKGKEEQDDQNQFKQQDNLDEDNQLQKKNSNNDQNQQDKDDKIKTQSEMIQQLEKELQELKDQKEKESQQQKSLIKQKSRENFKSKYYNMSLSNIEESDHESSFNKQDFMSRKIEEKDVLIQNLQDRIKMLMQSTQLSLNVYNHEGVVGNLGQGANYDINTNNNTILGGITGGGGTPSKNNSFVFSGQATLNGYPTRPKSSFNKLEGSNKDLIQRSISQAQTIEEILKNQQQKENKTNHKQNDQIQYEELIEKIDSQSRQYHELIKEHKALIKEKNILMKLINELSQTNMTLDTDFKILFKQVQQMNDKRIKDEQQKYRENNNSTLKLQQYLPLSQDIEDMDSLFEYIDILFKEKNYLQAGNMWQKINYEDLLGVKQEQQIDYLRAVLVVRDNQIQDAYSSTKNSPSKSPEKQKVQQHKLNEIVNTHMKNRQNSLNKLETKVSDYQHKITQLQDIIQQLKNKVELLQGEKDVDKRKNEKLKKEISQLMSELKIFKEQNMIEIQEKYEKQIGQLKNELRLTQKQQDRQLIPKPQQQLQKQSPNKKRMSYQGGQSHDDEDDSISNSNSPPLRQKSNVTDKVRYSSSSKQESQIAVSENNSSNLKRLSGMNNNTNKDETSKQSSYTQEQDLEQVLRKLYSQFFTNEYKSSQDKIRNKNSVFKELFEITINDIINSRDANKDLKKKYRNYQVENKQLKEELEFSNKELEKSQSYSIKLIKRLSNESHSKEHLDDLEKLNLLQLLKLISQLVQDFEDKQSKLDKYKKTMSIDSQIETGTQDNYNDFVNTLSKEDALAMLRELSSENEQLITSSNNFSKELQKIAKEVKQLQQQNEQLDQENQKLKKYCRIMRQRQRSRDFCSTQNVNTPVDQSECSRIQQNQDYLFDNVNDQANHYDKQIEKMQGGNELKQNQGNTIPQFRTLDSRSSIETDDKVHIRDIKQQKLSSTIIKQNITNNGTNLTTNRLSSDNNNNNSKICSRKPPREPNINLFTQCQPKSTNPNKKILESNHQTYGLKARPTQGGHKQTNSYYNMQKEINHISGTNLQLPNNHSYTECYNTPKQLLPTSMTPTNKFSDYFNNGEDKRDINKFSHLNLHHEQQLTTMLNHHTTINNNLESEFTSLRKTTSAFTPITENDYYNQRAADLVIPSKIDKSYRDSTLIPSNLMQNNDYNATKPSQIQKPATRLIGTATIAQSKHYSNNHYYISGTQNHITNNYIQGVNGAPSGYNSNTTNHNSSIESDNQPPRHTIRNVNINSNTIMPTNTVLANSGKKKIVALRHNIPINSFTSNSHNEVRPPSKYL